MKTTPKTGAQRKRDFDQRQRAQGRKLLQVWVSDEEHRKVRALIQTLRGEK